MLAALRRPRPPTPKRALQRLERLRRAWPERFSAQPTAAPLQSSGKPASEDATGTDIAVELADNHATNVPAPGKAVSLDQAHCPPVPGTLAAGIREYLYENQRAIWPHLKGDSISKPWWYETRSPAVNDGINPFAPKRRSARSPDLRADEVVRLYNAIAFAMWQHGMVMSAHVIILWETLHVYEHERATELLSEYLNEAKKWAAVGTTGVPRRRRRQRTGEGFEFRYVYVHENATQRGFHTHILCTVPRSAAKAFAAWSQHALARLARHRGDGRTVRVVASNAKTEEAAVGRCWNWFRYISKQLRPAAGWGFIDEPPRSLRLILKVWPYRIALPVTCAQLVGGSRDIWMKAQEEAGFKSQLVWGDDLDQIYSGRELNEWRDRLASEDIRRILSAYEDD